MIQKSFPCTGCSLCCFHVPWQEDGVACQFLDTETLRCKIYTVRPPVCRVDEMYDDDIKGKGIMTRPQWHEMNSLLCRELVAGAGLGDEFLVPLNGSLGIDDGLGP